MFLTKGLKKLIKILFLKADAIVRLFPVKQSNKVVLIKIDEIGDFVLWLASARNYKEIYQNREIILVANHVWSNLARIENICNHIIALDKRRFRTNLVYRQKKLLEIRRVGAEIIINTLFSRDSYISDAIVRCCDANTKVAFSGDESNFETDRERIQGDTEYNQLLKLNANNLHELELYNQFQQSLSSKSFPLTYPLMTYNKHTMENPYYILFPGAGSKKRQWPIASFSEVAKWIYEETGMTGIICGVKEEYKLAESLLKQVQIPMINLTGRTSLTQFVDKIANATFVLSNDTSAVHIACATKTPSLAILGGGHFGRFLPYVEIVYSESYQFIPSVVYHKMDCFGCLWKCHYVSYDELVPCIYKVTPDKVKGELEAIFSKFKIVRSSRD